MLIATTQIQTLRVKKLQRQKNNPKNRSDSQKKPFIEHFWELRNRFYLSLFVFLVGSVIGYFFQDRVIEFLIKPLNQPLYYSSPAGGFNFLLSLSFFFGLVISFPFVILQIFFFVNPALPRKRDFSFLFYFLLSIFLLVLGISFAYTISLPAAIKFLNEFSSGQVKSLISTNEYFSFVSRYLLGFGLLFQLPLIMIFINNIIRLKISQLMGFQRWVVLISFLIAAILTPTPDFLDQTIMALPIIFLYQISIIIVWFINRAKSDENQTM